MPKLDFWSWFFWAAVLLAQPFLVGAMIRRGWWRQWPSLFTLLIWQSSVSAGLFFIQVCMADTDERAAAYFYTYWLGCGISWLLEVWILVQLGLERCGGSPGLRKLVKRAIPSAALVCLLVVIALSTKVHMAPWGRVMTVVLDLNKAIGLAWLSLLLLIIGTSELLGIEWQPISLGIALGFAIQCWGETAVGWLIYLWPKHWNWLSDLHSVLYLLSLVAWGRCLVRRPIQQQAAPSWGRLTTWINYQSRILERLNPKP